MHLLIGIASAIALLYLWLSGHWFGRVLMFLVLAGVTGVLIVLPFADQHNAAAAAIFGALGVAVGWFVSGIPIYSRKWRVE